MPPDVDMDVDLPPDVDMDMCCKLHCLHLHSDAHFMSKAKADKAKIHDVKYKHDGDSHLFHILRDMAVGVGSCSSQQASNTLIHRPTHRHTDPPTTLPTDTPTERPTTQLIDRPTDRSTYRPTDRLAQMRVKVTHRWAVLGLLQRDQGALNVMSVSWLGILISAFSSHHCSEAETS